MSKAIVIHLKDFLPDIVTKHQSAFIPGRLINDNALNALKIFHSMKNKFHSMKGIIVIQLGARPMTGWNGVL